MNDYDGDEYRIEPDDGGVYRVNTGYGKPRFSRHELRDIGVSVVVLALAFAILYRSGSVMNFFEYHMGDLAYVGLFGLCIGLVVLSFLFHEFGHKFVAQKAGMWSEYRMYPLGLVLTILTAFFGFLFAAPGAVYINGNCSKQTNGKISIAGPIVNIVLAAVGIMGCLAMNHSGWVIFFLLLANLNAFLALFNLLPIPPLDGSKVIKWNVAIWIASIALAGAELVYVMFYMPALYWA